MSDEEEAGVAMEEGERGQDEDVEEEEGAREAMKSDPGEDEDEDGGSRRRTRGSFGIKVPRKEWPNVKQRKYRKRGRRGRPTKREDEDEEDEDDVEEMEDDEAEEQEEYEYDMDKVKAEQESDDEVEDIEGVGEDEDDVDFKPEWEKGGEQIVPKKHRKLAKIPIRRRRKRRRRRRRSDDGLDDLSKEARARRKGLADLQCPSCGFKSPLVQFIKRHWISTHSTDARRRFARKDEMTRRREQYMERQKANEQMRVRAYKREEWKGEEGEVVETKEEGLAREAAFFKTLDFADDPDKPFRCDQCPFRARLQTGLRQHFQKVHAVRKEVKFSQLTEEEKQLITLVILLDSTGEVKETYRCRNCEFQSTQKEDALAHAANQQCKGDGKTYKCKKCPYKANSKNQLRGHVNFQHGGSGF